MKVQDIFPLTPLTEAMRIPSNAGSIVTADPSEFRIGVEYEFHVDEQYGGLGAGFKDSREDEVHSAAAADLGADLRDVVEDFVYLSFEIKTFIDDFSHFREMITGESDEEAIVGLPNVTIALHTHEKNINYHSTTNRSIMGILTDVIPELSAALPLIHNMPPVETSEENEESADAVAEHFLSNPSLVSAMRQFMSVFEPYGDRASDEQAVVNRVVDDVARRGRVYQRELENRKSVKMKALKFIATDTEGAAAIDIVADTIRADGMYDNVENVELDGSVISGVEVVSKPLPVAQAFRFMNYMHGLINRVGSTSSQTGLHVNVSHKSFRNFAGSLDLLKIMGLIDVEFFQNLTTKKVHKYEERSSLVANSLRHISTPTHLKAIASAYVQGGAANMERVFRESLNPVEKMQAVNWEHMFFGFNPSERRIEFRFFGGKGYEDRTAEIQKDIIGILYSVKAVADNSFRPKDYFRGVIRILDRASQRVYGMPFSSVVNGIRSGTLT